MDRQHSIFKRDARAAQPTLQAADLRDAAFEHLHGVTVVQARTRRLLGEPFAGEAQ